VGFFEKGFCFVVVVVQTDDVILFVFLMMLFLALFFHELKSLFDPWTLIFFEDLIGIYILDRYGFLQLCFCCCCLCTFVAGDSKNVQSSTTKI